MSRKPISTLAVMLLAALGAASAGAQQGITDTEIVLGDILPLTGPPALLGVAHNLGVKAAVAEVNATGGINGRKVRLISEDDGYVLAFVHNPERGATDLVILAAQDFTAEPIARVHLPARIPLGFHGSWIPD